MAITGVSDHDLLGRGIRYEPPPNWRRLGLPAQPFEGKIVDVWTVDPAPGKSCPPFILLVHVPGQGVLKIPSDTATLL